LVEYVHLYRDKYVERLKKKDGKKWLQIYNLTSKGFLPMICDKEAERIARLIDGSDDGAEKNRIGFMTKE
jgi:hypothetical protein